MANEEFPFGIPPNYVPFWLRERIGEWWNFENTSNFWCCVEGGLTMQQWFYYDMFFAMWYLFYEMFYCDCGPS
jgi:hypothetical protein